jgi:hypothetical protein
MYSSVLYKMFCLKICLLGLLWSRVDSQEWIKFIKVIQKVILNDTYYSDYIFSKCLNLSR